MSLFVFGDVRSLPVFVSTSGRLTIGLKSTSGSYSPSAASSAPPSEWKRNDSNNESVYALSLYMYISKVFIKFQMKMCLTSTRL